LGYAGLQPDDPREIGPYRLLGQLGSGGMGQVFLGMSAGGRPIAVKVIRAELATDPDFRARFRGEVAAAQKVSGLFTALVVDADLDGPMPWLATAYVAGPSLTEAVRGHGPLPGPSLMALAAGLAEGLGAIHAAGVVHRDLKPSNVLLADDGPRVIDFGISEAAEASAAAGANVMIGSPGYMSPEQVLGVDIGPASDIFSLGAVLTYAATGQGPFGTGSHAALMYRLVNSPASLGDVPGELRPLVGSCLAKHPGDRPTAREMLAEVGALQPAPGWLAESIMSSFAEDGPDPESAAAVLGPAAAAVLGPAEASEPVALAETAGRPPSSGQPPRPGKPLYGGTSRPGRHRVSRTLASAIVTGGLVAGSAVAAFALIGANRPPAGHHLQPQAGAGAAATVPASAANPPASPGASFSASSAPSSSVVVSPSAYLSRASATFTGTSMPPTPIAIPSSGGSTGSSSPGKPPASSPPASSHPASSPPASSPPASSPPASSPPASTPPASSPPASSPPASTPPASSAPASSAPSSASVSPTSDPGSAAPSASST
jgi:serine/threonine protein kinase